MKPLGAKPIPALGVDASQGNVAREVDLIKRLPDGGALSGLARPDEHLDEAPRLEHARGKGADEGSSIFGHTCLLVNKFVQ